MIVNTIDYVTTKGVFYTNPIAVRFFEKYEDCMKNGKDFSPKDVLGEPPVIPDSPDTDARLEAYDDYVEYVRQYQILEERIKLLKGKA